MSAQTIVISGTGLYVPEHTISNEELVNSFNAYVDQFNQQHQTAIDAGDAEALAYSDVAFIEKASGIKNRFVLDKEGTLNPDLMRPSIAERTNEEQSIHCEVSIAAIEEALAQAGKTPLDVDAVIASCSAHPRMYPALAIEIQEALGIDGFAYDMNVACSSATFGIQAAYNAIKSGSAKCVVVVNPEITSAHANFKDRDSHFIFGDVCTAVVLETAETVTTDTAYDIIDVRLRTVYSNAIRNNFSYMSACDSHAKTDDKLFKQEGRKVFKEVVPMVSGLITAHLEANQLSAADLSRLWLHQANINMNQLIAKKVMSREVNPKEAPVILDKYANTASAGSIIAFHLFKDDFKANEKGIICSFGAGYSIGNIIVQRR